MDSNGTLAFAIENWTFSFLIRKPFHNVIKVPSMFTLWTPQYSFVHRLAFVGCYFFCCILLHFLCIGIIYWNWIKADWTFWEHYHTLNTVHNLNSSVFSEIMIAFKLRLFRVDVDFFGKDRVNLRSLAICTVECVCFGEIFSFPLDLNGEGELFEKMCWTKFL